MNEASKQLRDQVTTPLPLAPGQPAREEYEYVRGGTANLFILCEPLRGWRQLTVTQRRTRVDWAECMQALVDVHYPDAETIVLVLDNLNTHTPASLDEAFPPTEARRIAERLEIHYPPKHGSWLNIAAIEFSVLGRRIADDRTLMRAVAAWEDARNGGATVVTWRFTTEDARIKLKHLSPSTQS